MFASVCDLLQTCVVTVLWSARKVNDAAHAFAKWAKTLQISKSLALWEVAPSVVTKLLSHK